jgi:hypothetical protein
VPAEAIEDTGGVALSQGVIAHRARTIPLRPMKGGLVAHTLHEPRDINDAKAVFEDATAHCPPEMLPDLGLLPQLSCSQPTYIGGAEMGRIRMATRDELVVALARRYVASNRKERGRLLDEFVAVSGLHRKDGMRLFRVGQAQPPVRLSSRPPAL